ncbi:hypothetical protein ABEV74_19485 [Paenibacillus cisolokensis]|uniref:hypothetical protein n=1 Tax=Paenibacillus cisolokensis TaxID=1658519 RepID=UPI003D2E7B5B
MLILGIIGGVFGIVMSIFVIIGGIINLLADEGVFLVVAGLVTLSASITGIVAGVISAKKQDLASILFIIAAVVGSIFVRPFPFVGILFLIAGVMGLVKRPSGTTSKNT